MISTMILAQICKIMHACSHASHPDSLHWASDIYLLARLLIMASRVCSQDLTSAPALKTALRHFSYSAKACGLMAAARAAGSPASAPAPSTCLRSSHWA